MNGLSDYVVVTIDAAYQNIPIKKVATVHTPETSFQIMVSDISNQIEYYFSPQFQPLFDNYHDKIISSI